MSAYKVIRTEFRNLDSLIKALEDIGKGSFDFCAPQQNDLRLEGYMGRSSDMACLRLPKSTCGAYEDTGFAWDAATRTYRAIISTHDDSVNFGETALARVRQRYAVHEVRRQARSKGYNVQEQSHADGTVRMILVRR